MKNSIICIIIILSIVTLSFKGIEGVTLKVQINNLQNDEGKLSVTLFDKEDQFLKNGETKVVSIRDDKTAVVTYQNLKPGIYAASVYHDENDNNDLDKTFFGIPIEPYGFSNDARGFFGPASFEDSKFTVKEDKTISIKVE
ncbi:MAG: DUF2141 domain-containing protein [Reichenbachiella sp.]